MWPSRSSNFSISGKAEALDESVPKQALPFRSAPHTTGGAIRRSNKRRVAKQQEAASTATPNPPPTFVTVSFARVVHLVRDPLRTIDSRWNKGNVKVFRDLTRCNTDAALSEPLGTVETFLGWTKVSESVSESASKGVSGRARLIAPPHPILQAAVSLESR